MKKAIILFLSILLSVLSYAQVKDCKINDIELKGKVRVVEGSADLVVCFKHIPTENSMEITLTEQIPLRCGEWKITDDASDFSIQITNYEWNADLVITLYPNDLKEDFIKNYVWWEN